MGSREYKSATVNYVVEFFVPLLLAGVHCGGCETQDKGKFK